MLLVAFREKRSQRKPVLMLSTGITTGMMDISRGREAKACVHCCIPQVHGGVDTSDRKICHVSAERPRVGELHKLLFCT